MMKCAIISFLLLLASANSFAQDGITIPTIFTPNGDGINDVFIIRTDGGFESLTCTIFNRYGEPIYRYFGLNGTWDGFTHAGIKASAGTYFVLLEVTNANGEAENRQSTLQVQY